MKHLAQMTILALCLFGATPHHAIAGELPTEVETPVGKFVRMTPDVWITEPEVNGEAAITWKQTRVTGALIELHDTDSPAVLMLDLHDRVVAFVEKVSARTVRPDPDRRLAVFAADRFFVEGPGKSWVEHSGTGPGRTWAEVDRDEWSVYLHGAQAGDDMQIDLYTAKAITTGGRACATPCERSLLLAGLTSPISRVIPE